jgi:ribosome-associated translation inhibitor RaiA
MLVIHFEFTEVFESKNRIYTKRLPAYSEPIALFLKGFQMQVFIQTQGMSLSRQEREHIRHRLHQMLSRFGQKVIGATLHIKDVNGPRGGLDKDCQLVIELEDTTTVVRDRGERIRHVVDRALHRAAQALSRQRDKLHERTVRAPHLGRGRAPGRNRRMARAMQALNLTPSPA